jgi:hypothetical protein
VRTVKRLLVAYDETDPTAGQGDFLAVVRISANPALWGMRSRQVVHSGRMVYVGQEIGDKDLFAKLVDSGCKIENVQQSLRDIAAYLRLLEEFKLGNIVTIVPGDGDDGFSLVKVAEMPKLGGGTRKP